jgi:hypothetical protein
MNFQIHPQEWHLLSDSYVIRTRVPRDKITVDMITRRVRAGGVSVGTRVAVQCMNHEYTRVLNVCDYWVTSVEENLVRRDLDDERSMTSAQTVYRIEQCAAGWTDFNPEAEEVAEVKPHRKKLTVSAAA